MSVETITRPYAQLDIDWEYVADRIMADLHAERDKTRTLEEALAEAHALTRKAHEWLIWMVHTRDQKRRMPIDGCVEAQIDPPNWPATFEAFRQAMDEDILGCETAGGSYVMERLCHADGDFRRMCTDSLPLWDEKLATAAMMFLVAPDSWQADIEQEVRAEYETALDEAANDLELTHPEHWRSDGWIERVAHHIRIRLSH